MQTKVTDPQSGYGNIAPVLTSELWQRLLAAAPFDRMANASRACDDGNWPETIALCNSLLPADSRRKFGWDYVDKLREIAKRISERAPEPLIFEKEFVAAADSLVLLSIADILASYLPPREVAVTDHSSPNAGGTNG